MAVDPANVEEFEKKFKGNLKIDGFGLEVTNHMPCPWCAFPDFMKLQPAAGVVPGDNRPTIEATMSKEHTCVSCGRSGKNIVTRPGFGQVEFEFVQTGGPDSPSWMQPPPRRVDHAE